MIGLYEPLENMVESHWWPHTKPPGARNPIDTGYSSRTWYRLPGRPSARTVAFSRRATWLPPAPRADQTTCGGCRKGGGRCEGLGGGIATRCRHLRWAGGWHEHAGGDDATGAGNSTGTSGTHSGADHGRVKAARQVREPFKESKQGHVAPAGCHRWCSMIASRRMYSPSLLGPLEGNLDLLDSEYLWLLATMVAGRLG